MSEAPHVELMTHYLVECAGFDPDPELLAVIVVAGLAALHLVRECPEYAMALLAGLEADYQSLPQTGRDEIREWVQTHPIEGTTQ